MNEKRVISRANRRLWGIFCIGILLAVGGMFYYAMAMNRMFAPEAQQVDIWQPIAITSIAVSVYLIPTIFGRKKRNAAAIAVLNLYLGWTVIGWLVALVWASLKDRDSTQIRRRPAS